MNVLEISDRDYIHFYDLANAYYREGEDASTPQEQIDQFISFLFDKIVSQEIHGYFVKEDQAYIGFALWALDTEDFAFSEIPGFGTILEIGIQSPYRGCGYGRKLVGFIEQFLSNQGISECYVSAYGPAQKFWSHMGYAESGATASNGLPIMVKSIAGHNTITKSENGDLI